MIEQRPFSAASNKLAYAQAFAGPSARRAVRRVNERRRPLLLHWPLLIRRERVVLTPPASPAAVGPQS